MKSIPHAATREELHIAEIERRDTMNNAGSVEAENVPLLNFRGIDIEFANDKLHTIETCFLELSKFMAKATPKLFKEDRAAFDELTSAVGERIMAIRAQLVTFEAKVKSEYTTTPFSRRLILWLLSFFSVRASRTRDAVRHARQQRKALLDAATEYERFIADCKEAIDKIVFAKLRARQSQILGENTKWRKLCDDINDAEVDLEQYYTTNRQAELRGLKRKKKMMADSAYQQAISEMGDDV